MSIREPDLFDHADAARYPQRPGFKARETSKAAADSINGRAQSLRAAALEILRASLGLTADEVADRLGESVLAIRPRITELARLNQITDSGARRPNKSGKRAIVWRSVV